MRVPQMQPQPIAQDEACGKHSALQRVSRVTRPWLGQRGTAPYRCAFVRRLPPRGSADISQLSGARPVTHFRHSSSDRILYQLVSSGLRSALTMIRLLCPLSVMPHTVLSISRVRQGSSSFDPRATTRAPSVVDDAV